jgi:hypothetical protein
VYPRRPPAASSYKAPDALLYQSEALYLTAQSERTLEAYRLKRGGPPFIVIGKRGVHYRRGDLLDRICRVPSALDERSGPADRDAK